MQQTVFSSESLLMSAAADQRVVIAGSMLDVESFRAELEKLFAAKLNWPWIVMQAMQHRTIAMQWETLKRLGLVQPAIRSGLMKNWLAYCEQLSRASAHRNRVWLERLEWVFQAFESAGIEAVCIKGSALIGDIYDPQTRMLGDIDVLARSCDRKAARELLYSLGFRQGVIDPVTSTIRPLGREKRLFWSMNAHLMPKFTLTLGDPECPFMRFAVGFNFFDPGEKYSYPSEAVIDRRVRKSAGSSIYVPDVVDTVICLCIHIFRDGTSATMGFAGDHWNLWKFSDFRTKLRGLQLVDIEPVLRMRLEQADLQRAFYYALHYTRAVYGDPALELWFDLCGTIENLDYLHEIADGQRRVRCTSPFVEQLFHMGSMEVAGLKPAWSEIMGDGEWW